jgi:molybdopterin molybdotransferase
MLSVAAALEHVRATVAPFPAESLPLAAVQGLALAEDVFSRIDSPPFDKALMDGYAVRSADLPGGSGRLRVVALITAGQIADRPVGPGEAIQIMTGAPLPAEADCVVKVEDVRLVGDEVVVSTRPLQDGVNISRQGSAMRTGDRVLTAGTALRPPQLAALAELGCPQVPVRRHPTLAVLATGDELVPVDQTPGPGQIRNSNETMLVAQAAQSGCAARSLGIARDVREDLGAKILDGLAADILVLSGGVSAGTLDLVPSELAAAGVREVFHGVEMKPGKPLWFGVRPGDVRRNACYVFGLPGNPVSSMVCFELFVRSAIRRLMGISPAEPKPVPAAFDGEFAFRGDRPTYHPARLTWTANGPRVTLVPWQGSSDLRATVEANAMTCLPAIERKYQTGDVMDVLSWD